MAMDALSRLPHSLAVPGLHSVLRLACGEFSYGVCVDRFLTRLLLVHGQLSTYRLSRLIKYSFYKNVAFGFLLFFYQFYNGYSGQVSGLRCHHAADSPTLEQTHLAFAGCSGWLTQAG